MWLTAPNRIGIAAWQSGDSIWRVEARGGSPEGVAILVGNAKLSLVASDDRPLPSLNEQYVRGDELHLAFPQAGDDCEFGFRLVIRPVEFGDFCSGGDRAAFELLVSVQTTLLDAHPTLDLVTPARQGSRSIEVAGTRTAVQVAVDPSASAAILLGPQDAPFTSVIDDPGSLRLRLFGEFLEKGVIRRARPWIIVDRSQNEIDAKTVTSAWNALVQSPLPLG